MIRSLLLACAWLWARIFYRLRVEGLENVPREGSCILTVNHPGKLLAEAFVVLAVARHRLPMILLPTPPFRRRSIGASRSVRLFKLAPRFLPAIRVRRGGLNPVESHLLMLEALSNGEMILLMPEGEVSWDGRLKPARPGAAWMSLRAQVPIVPCAILGSYDIWPRWARRPRLTGRIRVRFGQPYLIADQVLDRMDYARLEAGNQKVMEEIGRLIYGEGHTSVIR